MNRASMSPLVARRLSNHHILGERFSHPAAVVRWMGAMQAQDYNQALWAIGMRLQSGTVKDVERAIAERAILRTWPMRGTIHFVAAEDAKWMVALSSAKLIARDARRQRQLELDADILNRSRDQVIAMLQGGQVLARGDILGRLEAAGIRTHDGRGYHILWYLTLIGVLCMGPMQGKQQTFTLLDEWVPQSRELTREASLAELAGRYIISHGPATDRDFAWWAGLSLTEARQGLATATPALIQETLDGMTYWQSPDASALAAEGAGVHLLPGFDEYLLGYQDRSAILAAEHADRVVPGGNGVFRPMIAVAGHIVGTWKAAPKATHGVAFEPFIPLEAWEDHLAHAARRFGDFWGRKKR